MAGRVHCNEGPLSSSSSSLPLYCSSTHRPQAQSPLQRRQLALNRSSSRSSKPGSSADIWHMSVMGVRDKVTHVLQAWQNLVTHWLSALVLHLRQVTGPCRRLELSWPPQRCGRISILKDPTLLRTWSMSARMALSAVWSSRTWSLGLGGGCVFSVLYSWLQTMRPCYTVV